MLCTWTTILLTLQLWLIYYISLYICVRFLLSFPGWSVPPDRRSLGKTSPGTLSPQHAPQSGPFFGFSQGLGSAALAVLDCLMDRNCSSCTRSVFWSFRNCHSLSNRFWGLTVLAGSHRYKSHLSFILSDSLLSSDRITNWFCMAS